MAARHGRHRSGWNEPKIEFEGSARAYLVSGHPPMLDAAAYAGGTGNGLSRRVRGQYGLS